MSWYVGRIQLQLVDHRDQPYYAGWEPLDRPHGYDVDLSYERARRHVQRGHLRCGYSMWGDDCDRAGRCCQGNPGSFMRQGWRLTYATATIHRTPEGAA